ncbi:MAG: hypothetical protein ACYC6N_22910, partial [Pirellulaceae bacterium]
MLKQFAQSVEPGVVVVEPRVLRRVIRLDGRVQGFPQLLSRRETYPIERNRLLALVDPSELGVASPGSLPDRLVLLGKSENVGSDEERSPESFVQCLARPLFHACLHLELEKHFAHEPTSERMAAERRRQLGETEFAEIHAVLLQDDRLFPASSDVEVYVEFAAWYLELSHYAPETLSCHFPGVRDWHLVDGIVRQDIDDQALLERWPIRLREDTRPSGKQKSRVEVGSRASGESITLAEFRQLQMQAERAAAVGNHVKAALLHASAAVRGPEKHSVEAHAAACAELAKLAQRLWKALNLADAQVEEWARTLPAL